MHVLAYMVRRGDRMTSEGEPQEVKAARGRRSRHKEDVVLVFKSGRSLRVPADAPVRVRRSWPSTRRRGRQ